MTARASSIPPQVRPHFSTGCNVAQPALPHSTHPRASRDHPHLPLLTDSCAMRDRVPPARPTARGSRNALPIRCSLSFASLNSPYLHPATLSTTYSLPFPQPNTNTHRPPARSLQQAWPSTPTSTCSTSPTARTTASRSSASTPTPTPPPRRPASPSSRTPDWRVVANAASSRAPRMSRWEAGGGCTWRTAGTSAWRCSR